MTHLKEIMATLTKTLEISKKEMEYLVENMETEYEPQTIKLGDTTETLVFKNPYNKTFYAVFYEKPESVIKYFTHSEIRPVYFVTVPCKVQGYNAAVLLKDLETKEIFGTVHRIKL